MDAITTRYYLGMPQRNAQGEIVACPTAIKHFKSLAEVKTYCENRISEARAKGVNVPDDEFIPVKVVTTLYLPRKRK